MASSMADGIILSIFCCPAFIRSAMEHVRAGAAKAGRSTDEMDIADYIIFSVDEDGDAARRAAKHLVAHYVMRVADTFRYEAAGLDPERVSGIQQDLWKPSVKTDWPTPLTACPTTSSAPSRSPGRRRSASKG